VYDSIEGMPLGKVNFVLRDSRDRIWITVSTRTNPWPDAICNTLADGYIAVMDEAGLRIVADGFVFTNEIRLDAKEEWLYVAETCARRVSRLRVAADASLRGREVFGPSSLGSGAIDGIAFDAYGNLWATMIFADKLVAITPDGDLLTLLDDRLEAGHYGRATLLGLKGQTSLTAVLGVTIDWNQVLAEIL
jgi:gluconolactonase